MENDNIRLGKERIPVYVRCYSLPGFTNEGIVRYDAHVQGPGNLCRPLANTSQTDDAHRFSSQLNQGIFPKAPIGIMSPFATLYGLVVSTYVMAHFQ